jgi:hypothetical protein
MLEESICAEGAGVCAEAFGIVGGSVAPIVLASLILTYCTKGMLKTM